MGELTVVTSGKGGAGKSTVTTGLGCALARRGNRVLLVDGDAGLRSLDVMLGIGTETVYDMADIFSGNCEPIRAVYPSPVCENVSVIPAPVSLEQICSPADMRRLCRGFAQHYDHVIIDCPAGLGAGFETAVAGAERALVVTTPDMVCARDACIVGERLANVDMPARLVINRLRPAPILQGKLPNVDELIDLSGIRLIGVVPEDEAMSLATACGTSIPERCAAALCFDNLARRLEGEEVPLAPLQKL